MFCTSRRGETRRIRVVTYYCTSGTARTLSESNISEYWKWSRDHFNNYFPANWSSLKLNRICATSWLKARRLLCNLRKYFVVASNVAWYNAYFVCEITIACNKFIPLHLNLSTHFRIRLYIRLFYFNCLIIFYIYVCMFFINKFTK